MILARPPHLFSGDYVLSEAGRPVGELDMSLWREAAKLHHDGKVHRIEREGLMSGAWQLKDGDEVLLEAKKPSMFKRRFEVNVRGAWLELAPTSWTARRFGLVGPDWADLGEIRRRSWFSRTLEVDLADQVPRLAQLFLLFLAVTMWRRQDRNASS